MRLISDLVRLFTPGGKAAQQVVYRVKEANELKDPWKRRIIYLADGRLIGEIFWIPYSARK